MSLIVKCRKCGKRIHEEKACPRCGSPDLRYIIDYFPRGRNGGRRQFTLPAEVDSREIAQDHARAFMAARKPRRLESPRASEASTVVDLFPDYLSWYRMHRAVTTWRDLSNAWEKDIKRILGECVIASITSAHFTLYQKLRGASVSARTVNKELQYFGGFLRWARKEHRIPVERIEYERLPYKRPLPIVLSTAEVARILEAAAGEPIYYALVCCLYTLGLRISEARGLKVGDVDFENLSVRVLQKGGAQKILPINARVSEAIQGAIAWRKAMVENKKGWMQTPYVFSIRKGGEPIQSFRKTLAKICGQAGVSKRVHPHLFRHSIATHLLGADVNLRTIQQYLGHTQSTTTEFYTHVAMGHLRNAQKQIER